MMRIQVKTMGKYGASLRALLVKNLPAMQETPVQFLGWEDTLAKGLHVDFSLVEANGNYSLVAVRGLLLHWLLLLQSMDSRAQGLQ